MKNQFWQGFWRLADPNRPYFFAPWNCLSESELEDLFSLSTELRDGLKKSEGK